MAEENKNTTPAPSTGKKKVPMFLIAIIVTLAVLASVLSIKLHLDLKKSQEEREVVSQQKNDLEAELQGLIVDYDSLRTENDSINIKLEAEQEKIRRLLKVQASNATKIKMYKKELATLRKVMRSYIVQIDSLNTRNRELTEENIQVRQELRTVRTDFDNLSEEKEKLTSTVAQAQVLSAKNILAEGLNKSSKPKDKISKVVKIRTCFTVRENNVAEAGKKMIYLRIIRPDDIVLSNPDADLFNVGEESLMYSAKRELEYDNQDIDLCIYWDKTEEMVSGTYFVSLYCEGHEIGTTTFSLK